MKYKVKIYRKIDKNLISKWEKLWDGSSRKTIYNSPEWFKTFVDTNNKYYILACFDKETLVGVLTLFEYKIYKIKCIATPGHGYLNATPVLTKDNDIEVIKKLIINAVKIKPVCISNLDEEISFKLKKQFVESLISIISVNPYIDFNENYKKYISKSNLKQISKVLNKQSKNLTLKLFKGNQSLQALEKIFKLEEESSKKLKNKAIFNKKSERIIYRNIVKNLNKFVEIGILYFKKYPIAYELAFIADGKAYGYYIGFNWKYKYLNPGKVLLYLLFNKYSTNHSSMDLGGGISQYKTSFTPKYRVYYDFYYSNNQFVLIYWKLINKARRVKQILFPIKFTRDHEFLFKTI